jgi:hypothetical protein
MTEWIGSEQFSISKLLGLEQGFLGGPNDISVRPLSSANELLMRLTMSLKTSGLGVRGAAPF